MSNRTMRATYNGRTYEIPEIWLAGFLQTWPGATILLAVKWWAYQTELAEREAR